MDQEVIDFFAKLDEHNTLQFLIDSSVFSLKNSYNYIASYQAGYMAISRHIQNHEFDETLIHEYFKNSDIEHAMPLKDTPAKRTFQYDHPMTISDYNPATPALRPYQISAAFYRQILLGNTPIFNFSVVRNPYVRFYRKMHMYYDPNKVELLFQLNDIFMKDHFKNRPYCNSITKSIIYNRINYDFLIRFENFDDDMTLLFPNYNPKKIIKPFKLEKFDAFYSHQEVIDYVKTTYKEDFENFGYSYDVKEYLEYDNSLLPRNIDKLKQPQKSYSCDINILQGSSIQSLGYFQEKKCSGTTIDFFLTNNIPNEAIDKIAVNGYRLFEFNGIQKALIDFANKLPNK